MGNELARLGVPGVLRPRHRGGAMAAVATYARRGGGRPAQYVSKDGKPCVGVTTVCGRYKDASALIAWAWKQGRDGKDFRDSRDKAASVGTYAHALIDADIHNIPPPARPSEMSDEDEKRAHTAHEAFVQWRDMVKLDVVATEVPLVSDMWRYGGTIDCIARIGGKLMVLDFKSSNGTYPEHVCQVAAYRQLWRECMREQLDDACLLRVGKEHGDFAYKSLPSSVLDMGWQAFTGFLSAYEVDAGLKAVCK